MMDEVSDLSKEELSKYLERHGLEPEVIDTIKRNRISGASFLELKSEHLKELFPVIGDGIAVNKILEKVKTSSKSGKNPSECGWLSVFEVPSEFSFYTKEAIKTGVLTKSARVEIVGALATRILQYTRNPTPIVYQTVCKKLIERYPTLQDPVGNGYGTWKCQLRTKFNNLRRGEKRQSRDGSDSGVLPTNCDGNDDQSCPPTKKKRNDAALEEKCEHINNRDLIRLEWEKRKPKLSTLKELMDATYKRRRDWIAESCPSAGGVLETYPCLASGKILRHELRMMLDLKMSTDELMKDWPLWIKRVYAYSKLEAKSRAISEILSQSEVVKEGLSRDDHDGVYFLYLLTSLLSGKKASNAKLLYQFQDSVNLDIEISKVDKGTPYLVMLTSEEGQQYFVVIEKSFIAESNSLTTAIVDLIGSYFVFDIVYPQSLYAVLIFIQHIVLGIVDKQKVPQSVHVLHSSLAKITV